MGALLTAALVVGIVDIVNAMVYWNLRADATPTAILQSVAAGLLGKASFGGGAQTAALGLALHLAIMCAMAAVYGLAARRWRWMLDRWVVAGVGYGLLTWVAMNYVVVPLSRAGSPPFNLTWFIDGLVVHVVLVGLVFAFVARRSLRAR